MTPFQHLFTLYFNPRHTSLHFKRVGRSWSTREGLHCHALGVGASEGVVWFWIGSHADYDKPIGG